MTIMRKRINYSPTWKSVRKHAFSMIEKNYWRVSHIIDKDELIQEAYIKYLVCCRKYSTVKNPRHFTSLFRTAFSNHLNYLSNKNSLELKTINAYYLHCATEKINSDPESVLVAQLDALIY